MEPAISPLFFLWLQRTESGVGYRLLADDAS
jgi:hypothetical protein